MGLSFLFSMMLLFSFRIVANQNPYLINTTKSLAQQIQSIEDETEKHKVVILDRKFSALPFYLHEKTIQTHIGRFDTNREIMFEKDYSFHNYYWDLTNAQDSTKLIDFLKLNKGIIVANCSRTFDDTIQKYLNNMKVKKANRWCLYH